MVFGDENEKNDFSTSERQEKNSTENVHNATYKDKVKNIAKCKKVNA